MKRRIISYLIIAALFLSMVPNAVYARELKQRYTQVQMDTIVQKYDYNEDILNDLFCTDVAVGYWGMANNIKQNGVLTWALDMSSRLIGEYPEKQDYAEILANLITMQTGELAEQIETQSRFDDLKDVSDYAWDVVEIAAAFVGASGALEAISAAIDTGVSGVGDVIIKNNEQAKYYEVTLQEYSQSNAFLHAISKYAENEELRNVAASLMRANDTLLVKRLEYLADASANIAEYEAEFFINNMSMELLKEADLYVTDETVKFFVDEGISLKNAILAATDAAKFAFKMIILAGDIGFGTSDVYNRYQEMKAVADIAASLVKANKDIHIPSENTQEALEVIQEKCNLYKALIVTHARGEYLLYQLLMNDAGALSDIRWIIEYFKNPEETTDAWYNGQIDVLTKYCNILGEMFVLPHKDDAVACLLSQVNAYYTDGSLWYRYDFTYNAACQLTAVCNNTDPTNQVTWKYSYDDIGHLVRIEQTMSGNVSTMKEYVYDETGRLNSWYENNGYGGTEYSCIYDEQNRRIQTIGKNTEEIIVTKCEYNSDGLLEEQHSTYTSNATGESYSTLSEFTYDADGRKIYDQIDAGGYTYQYTYRYDLGPLCICQDARGTYVLILYDEINSELWEMDAAEGELIADDAGRLVKIQCDRVYYEFVYDVSLSQNASLLLNEDSTNSEKVLSKINCYTEGTLSWTREFLYNNQQLPSEITTLSFDDQGNIARQSTAIYSYDAEGRLLAYYDGELSKTLREYVYENGKLTSYSDGGLKYTCEYDEYGKRKQVKYQDSTIKGIIDYLYNSEGMLIQTTDLSQWVDSDGPYKTEITNYAYDSSGRINESFVTTNQSEHHYEYFYDYLPFVVQKINSNVCDVFVNDVVGHPIWSLTLSWNRLNIDDDGYLVEGYKTLWGNGKETTYRYEFIYVTEK